MNKTQLVEALAERIGDRRTAVAAVDGLLATIVDTVRSGDSVALTGFGVFEGRARAARTARNPRTGAAVAVPATTVPAFRPGAGFRAAVATAPVVDGSPAAAAEAPAKATRSAKAAKSDAKSDAKPKAAKPGAKEAKDRSKKSQDKAGKDKKAKSKK